MKPSYHSKITRYLNEKSEYFVNLEKRKTENVSRVEYIKSNQIFDSVMNKEYNIRDYAYFGNKRNSDKIILPKIQRQGVKIKFLTETEKSYPNKYLKKDVVFDEFSKIYMQKSDPNTKTSSKLILNPHKSKLSKVPPSQKKESPKKREDLLNSLKRSKVILEKSNDDKSTSVDKSKLNISVNYLPTSSSKHMHTMSNRNKQKELIEYRQSTELNLEPEHADEDYYKIEKARAVNPNREASRKLQTKDSENLIDTVGIMEPKQYEEERGSVSEGSLSKVKVDEYDYDKHSWEIFETINKLRSNPQKFIKKIGKLVKEFDEENNSIAIVSENVNLVLSDKVEPNDFIAFLQNVAPQPPLLWSSLLQEQVVEDMLLMRENNLTINDLIAGEYHQLRFPNEKLLKLHTDFIVSPKITVLLISLFSENNRKILFSSDIGECAVFTMPKTGTDLYTNEGSSLIYFIKNNSNERDDILIEQILIK